MYFIALPYDENSTSFETTPDFGRKAITQKVGLGWQREGLATKMLSWMKILSTQQTHHEPLTRAPECAFDFNSNAMCSFYVPASIEYGFKDNCLKDVNWFGSMPIHPDHFGAAILDFDAWPFFISVYMGLAIFSCIGQFCSFFQNGTIHRENGLVGGPVDKAYYSLNYRIYLPKDW